MSRGRTRVPYQVRFGSKADILRCGNYSITSVPRPSSGSGAVSRLVIRLSLPAEPAGQHAVHIYVACAHLCRLSSEIMSLVHIYVA